MKRNIACFTLIVCLSVCIMDTKAQRSSSSIYLEEDLKPLLLGSKANDQNYTMGLGFAFSRPSYDTANLFRPVRWISGTIHKKLMQSDSWKLNHPAFTIAGTAFTPKDTRQTNVIPEDRPYSFLLALSTRQAYTNMVRHRHISTELNFGVLGLPIGKWVQTGIHQLSNKGDTREPFTPKGWHNQISKGGEPTLLLAVQADWLLTKGGMKDLSRRPLLEIKHGLRGMLGYYTGVNYDLAMRFGLIDPRNWVGNFNPLGSVNKIAGQSIRPRKTEVFLFGSARPGVMLYNEMLNGGIRNSKHTLSFSEVNHFILEWSSGIGISIPGKKRIFNLAWIANAGRTSELNTSLRRTHTWGGLLINTTR